MNTRIFVAAVAAILLGAAVSITAQAQEASSLSDEHINRIQNNCQSVLATLNRIHANDTPVYINRNQAYFSISDKLIARLNSRLALNRFDTTNLVKIANDFDMELTKFRVAYKQYDTAMADLVKRNCNKQPVNFYETVAEVRKQRAAVHANITKLNALIKEYSEAVDAFEKANETKLRAGRND